MSTSLKYRADIDGIRAIAVVSVVLYHLEKSLAPGGFVGVDIFFVISGFLIGTIILREVGEGSFTFARFYERRIKRLFPAYFAVAIITALAGWFILLPEDYRQFGQSLAAATAFVSNILFFMETGYFDAASETKPLLHTWSLAVEEQFYIFFPPLILILAKFLPKHRFERGVNIALALTFVASFAACLLYIKWDQSAVFFLFPFRAWEMLMGVGLAATASRIHLKGLAAEGCAWVGFALMLLPILLYSEQTLFPGIAALWPCLGVTLVIAAGLNHSNQSDLPVVNRLLGTKGPVAIGLISYSLYLWHWPVIVLARYGFDVGHGLLDILGLLAASVGFAILSYYFVEKPFRHLKFSHRRLTLFAGATVFSFLLIGFGALLNFKSGLPDRLPPEARPLYAATQDFFKPAGKCYDQDNDKLPGVPYCLVGNREATSEVLVWGDSHANAMRTGFDVAARDANVAAIIIYNAGCPPFFGYGKKEHFMSERKNETCAGFNQKLETYFAGETLQNVKRILFVGRWAYYANGGGIGADDHIKIDIFPSDEKNVEGSNMARFQQGFADTINILTNQTRQVFILQQVPEIEPFNARDFAVKYLRGGVSAEEMAQSVQVSKSNVEARQGQINAFFAKMAAQPDVFFLKTHDQFCDEDLCFVLKDGVPRLIDNNHVTSTMSKDMISTYRPAF